MSHDCFLFQYPPSLSLDDDSELQSQSADCEPSPPLPKRNQTQSYNNLYDPSQSASNVSVGASMQQHSSVYAAGSPKSVRTPELPPPRQQINMYNRSPQMRPRLLDSRAPMAMPENISPVTSPSGAYPPTIGSNVNGRDRSNFHPSTYKPRSSNSYSAQTVLPKGPEMHPPTGNTYRNYQEYQREPGRAKQQNYYDGNASSPNNRGPEQYASSRPISNNAPHPSVRQYENNNDRDIAQEDQRQIRRPMSFVRALQISADDDVKEREKVSRREIKRRGEGERSVYDSSYEISV